MNEEPGSEGAAAGEEELRARLEEELKKLRVRDVLIQTAITLVNLGGQRLGATERTRDARDLDQARTAIEGVRVLLPLLEQDGAEEVRPLRDALAQLQIAYAREAEAGGEPSSRASDQAPSEGQEGGESAGAEAQKKPRSSGRLWVPPGSSA